MRCALAGLTVFILLGTMTLTAAEKQTAPAAKIAHGKYLVERVGMCSDCHTPRDDKGEPIREKWLQGAVLPIKPIGPMPVWAGESADIAGLPGWSTEEAIRFFMTGIARNGLPARPPMPTYRFNQSDAEAVVAYLKSLAAEKK